MLSPLTTTTTTTCIQSNPIQSDPIHSDPRAAARLLLSSSSSSYSGAVHSLAAACCRSHRVLLTLPRSALLSLGQQSETTRGPILQLRVYLKDPENLKKLSVLESRDSTSHASLLHSSKRPYGTINHSLSFVTFFVVWCRLFARLPQTAPLYFSFSPAIAHALFSVHSLFTCA